MLDIKKLSVGNYLLDQDGEEIMITPALFDQPGVLDLCTGKQITPDMLAKHGFLHPKPTDLFYVHESDMETYLNDSMPTFRYGFLEADTLLTVSIGTSNKGFLFAIFQFEHELQQFFNGVKMDIWN